MSQSILSNETLREIWEPSYKTGRAGAVVCLALSIFTATFTNIIDGMPWYGYLIGYGITVFGLVCAFRCAKIAANARQKWE